MPDRAHILPVHPLDQHAFAPYGQMLGLPFGQRPDVPGFSNADTDFWHTHLFQAGDGGQAEVLWVNYRSTAPIQSLEVHHLTQQAIVPLEDGLVHVVALSDPDGMPDLASLKAFRIPRGQGICMAPGCWHASRVDHAQVTCLMLTRASTTVDLIGQLTGGAQARESGFQPIPPVTYARAI